MPDPTNTPTNPQLPVAGPVIIESAGHAPLPDYSRAVLIRICIAASVRSVIVTRTLATPHDQARVMYDNLIGTGLRQGVQKQHDLYLEPGDKVIDVFTANQTTKTRAEIIDLMAAKIVEIGPSKVSHHCGDPNILSVFDVDPARITPLGQHLAFEAAVNLEVTKGTVSKFLTPSNADPAYHLEVPNSSPTSPSHV